MTMSIVYSAITILVFLIGIILDVSGLYIGVKFATLKKIKPSKIGYFLMRIGEVLEGIALECFIFIPILIIIDLIR